MMRIAEIQILNEDMGPNPVEVLTFLAGLLRARSARTTEPHTHGIWSTSFRLVAT